MVSSLAISLTMQRALCVVVHLCRDVRHKYSLYLGNYI